MSRHFRRITSMLRCLADRHRLLSIIVLGGLGVFVCSSMYELLAQTANRPVPVLRIGSGDLLEISVFGAPELTQKSRVGAEGDIAVPLLGNVHVAGLTPEQASRALEHRLIDAGLLKEPAVTVFINEYATQGATVVGEVNKPGTYPVMGSRRLLDVISMAGGLTEKAGKQVTVTHRDQQHEDPVTVTLPRSLDGISDNNVDILPGDTIVVSKAGIVYVVGEVGRPGGFVFDNSDSLTILQALALAEGAKPTASLDHARIIRKTADGVQDLPIPLKRILAAKSADQKLVANDIVFVPNSALKSAFRRSAESALQVATGVAIYRF
jgi:polysaccharide export outer membrane protein